MLWHSFQTSHEATSRLYVCQCDYFYSNSGVSIIFSVVLKNATAETRRLCVSRRCPADFPFAATSIPVPPITFSPLHPLCWNSRYKTTSSVAFRTSSLFCNTYMFYLNIYLGRSLKPFWKNTAWVGAKSSFLEWRGETHSTPAPPHFTACRRESIAAY